MAMQAGLALGGLAHAPGSALLPESTVPPSALLSGKRNLTSCPVYTSATAEGRQLAQERVMVVPSHKLLFCRVDKAASTESAALLCSLNKHHPAKDKPGQAKEDSDWYSAAASTQRMSEDDVSAAFCDASWTTAAIVRDPLERFLSAYLSECTDGYDGKWHQENICKPVFNTTTPSFEQVLDVVSRPGFRMPHTTPGSHWLLQSEFCGGTLGEPRRGYDMVFVRSRETAAADWGTILRAAGWSDPEAEPGFREYLQKSSSSQQAADDSHVNGTSSQLTEYYANAGLLRKALAYLGPDYRNLGIPLPKWAAATLGGGELSFLWPSEEYWQVFQKIVD